MLEAAVLHSAGPLPASTQSREKWLLHHGKRGHVSERVVSKAGKFANTDFSLWVVYQRLPNSFKFTQSQLVSDLSPIAELFRDRIFRRDSDVLGKPFVGHPC